MYIDQVCLELLHHIQDLFKVLLIQGRLSLGRISILEEPELCQGHSCLEGWIVFQVSRVLVLTLLFQ